MVPKVTKIVYVTLSAGVLLSSVFGCVIMTSPMTEPAVAPPGGLQFRLFTASDIVNNVPVPSDYFTSRSQDLYVCIESHDPRYIGQELIVTVLSPSKEGRQTEWSCAPMKFTGQMVLQKNIQQLYQIPRNLHGDDPLGQWTVQVRLQGAKVAETYFSVLE